MNIEETPLEELVRTAELQWATGNRDTAVLLTYFARRFAYPSAAPAHLPVLVEVLDSGGGGLFRSLRRAARSVAHADQAGGTR